MPKRLIWMAITPDEYEQIMYIEDSAEALADVMGLKPQTIRRQKWYWEHKAKNSSRNCDIAKYKYRIETMLKEE